MRPLGLLALGLCACVAQARYPVQDGARVLFVGNSITGVKANGIPGYTNAALQQSSAGLSIGSHRIQVWNQDLRTHWYHDGTRQGANTLVGHGIYADWPTAWINARDVIARGHPDGNPWDYVVLQGFGDDTSATANSFDADGKPQGNLFVYASRFHELITAQGAQTLLYMRWSNNPDSVGLAVAEAQTTALIANYTELGQRLGVPVVPIAAIGQRLYLNPPAGKSAGWLYTDNIHFDREMSGLLGYAFASYLGRVDPTSFTLNYGHYQNIDPAIDQTLKQTIWAVIQERETWAQSISSSHPATP